MRELTEDEIKCMKHAVGMKPENKKQHWGLRNRYAVGSGDVKGLAKWRGLVTMGLAEQISADTGSVISFALTEAGCKAIGLGKADTKRALED